MSHVHLQASLISPGQKQTHQVASESPLELISRSAENACQAAKFNRPLLGPAALEDYANLPLFLLFPSLPSWPATPRASGCALDLLPRAFLNPLDSLYRN